MNVASGVILTEQAPSASVRQQTVTSGSPAEARVTIEDHVFDCPRCGASRETDCACYPQAQQPAGARGSALAGLRRDEAAAAAEALERRREWLIGQRAAIERQIAQVLAERQRLDLVAYAASRVRPCPDCGKPMAGVEQGWMGGYHAFTTYCVGCRLAAQGLTEAEFEATA